MKAEFVIRIIKQMNQLFKGNKRSNFYLVDMIQQG